MARLAIEHTASEELVLIDNYDSTKWSGGSLIKKRNDIGTIPFIGPIVSSVARPVEQSPAIPGIYPHVIRWSNTIDWVFLADNATAAATRRIQLYTYNRETSAWGYIGFITLTYSTTTVHTIRSLRMTYDKYTNGTVSVSGTTVTGSGTAWVSNAMTVGSRIGFGSTDPTEITNWYYISAVGSDTSITLSASGPTSSSGTAYVIEDLRCVTVTTNATATNGGVFLTKGLNRDIFTVAGTTIPAATTVDNIRAVYWLADASTETNTIACGSGLVPKNDWLNQDFYVLNSPSAGNYNIYKYNIRKALTLSSGKDTTTLQLKTGTQAVTGTISQSNNCRYGTLNHGPASGQASLYFVTTTRIYCAKISSIIDSSTTWIDYVMTEVPPGGVSTFAATGSLACVEIADTIDRLIVMSSGSAGARSYITKYNSAGDPMDHIFLVDDKQIDQSSADSGTVPHPSILALQQTPWGEGGLLYLAGVGTTAATNLLHVVPIGADWQYTSITGQRLISPVFSCPNNNCFRRVYTIRDSFQGSVNLGKPCDPFRIYFRTSGIVDNSGSWTIISDGNDISGAGADDKIQFMVEFKCISDICVPGRLFTIGVVYDDLSTDSHFQPSVANSNQNDKYFAWRFSTAFGNTVPDLRIRLYDAVNGGGALVDDDSVAQNGTWEKSINGGATWTSYNSSDLTNEETYIRFTPASLGDNIRVRALLTLK